VVVALEWGREPVSLCSGFQGIAVGEPRFRDAYPQLRGSHAPKLAARPSTPRDARCRSGGTLLWQDAGKVEAPAVKRMYTSILLSLQTSLKTAGTPTPTSMRTIDLGTERARAF
jgi:hypothetical protein